MGDAAVGWDFRCFTWSEVLSVGIDDRQLRGALDRGLLKAGAKRGRLLMFSVRERFVIDLIARMVEMWMPISTACQVASEVGTNFDLIEEFNGDQNLDILHREMMVAIYNVSGKASINFFVKDKGVIPPDVIKSNAVMLISISRAYLRQLIFVEEAASGQEVSAILLSEASE